jgi:hypothetical protein
MDRHLAALWGEQRIPPPSQCTERFSFATRPRARSRGVRVSDGINIWEVDGDTSNTGTYVDALVKCTSTAAPRTGSRRADRHLVDPPTSVPGCTGVSNTPRRCRAATPSSSRTSASACATRPRAESTCGPRVAYEARRRSVELGRRRGSARARRRRRDGRHAPAPGEVHILLLEGERDDAGVLTSVVPEPSSGVLAAVTRVYARGRSAARRHVITKAALFVDFDSIVEYYIAESRSTRPRHPGAVQTAYAAWLLWQQSAIGRDINPSSCASRLVNAGAKRTVITEPAFEALMRDQSARCVYSVLIYGGVEDD